MCHYLDKYIINGGTKLYGEVEISGAKNAAVAIIPAALLVDGVCRIENIPHISDADMLMSIIEGFGAKITVIDKTTVDIDCREVKKCDAGYDMMRRIRASYYLIGAMLGRFGSAKTTMPGGCNFGVRPIDQHVKGFTAMGANVDVKNGFVYADTGAQGLVGTKIYLDKISVGATINIMIAAATAKGKTIIENAAKEPHIVDIANFLNSMGADVRGAGTDTIKVHGTPKLHGGSYSIIPDQIEAGTYMMAVTAAGGEVRINNIIPKHLECITAKIREMGATVEENGDNLLVTRDKPLVPTNVKTLPYPGFPTDMQPQISTALCLASGASVVTESVWDNRYKYVNELKKLGANIEVADKTAMIEGVSGFAGTAVKACDLRAGAAMVIAGICASGTTVVEDVVFIERGYEDFVSKLRNIGADISILHGANEEEEQINLVVV